MIISTPFSFHPPSHMCVCVCIPVGRTKKTENFSKQPAIVRMYICTWTCTYICTYIHTCVGTKATPCTTNDCFDVLYLEQGILTHYPTPLALEELYAGNSSIPLSVFWSTASIDCHRFTGFSKSVAPWILCMTTEPELIIMLDWRYVCEN